MVNYRQQRLMTFCKISCFGITKSIT